MVEKNDILTSATNNILTSRELGKILGVGEKVILTWARKGMPHLRVNLRTIRFELDKVLAYLHKEGRNG